MLPKTVNVILVLWLVCSCLGCRSPASTIHRFRLETDISHEADVYVLWAGSQQFPAAISLAPDAGELNVVLDIVNKSTTSLYLPTAWTVVSCRVMAVRDAQSLSNTMHVARWPYDPGSDCDEFVRVPPVQVSSPSASGDNKWDYRPSYRTVHTVVLPDDLKHQRTLGLFFNIGVAGIWGDQWVSEFVTKKVLLLRNEEAQEETGPRDKASGLKIQESD
jgi:hypothetical protein